MEGEFVGLAGGDGPEAAISSLLSDLKSAADLKCVRESYDELQGLLRYSFEPYVGTALLNARMSLAGRIGELSAMDDDVPSLPAALLDDHNENNYRDDCTLTKAIGDFDKHAPDFAEAVATYDLTLDDFRLAWLHNAFSGLANNLEHLVFTHQNKGGCDLYFSDDPIDVTFPTVLASGATFKHDLVRKHTVANKLAEDFMDSYFAYFNQVLYALSEYEKVLSSVAGRDERMEATASDLRERAYERVVVLAYDAYTEFVYEEDKHRAQELLGAPLNKGLKALVNIVAACATQIPKGKFYLRQVGKLKPEEEYPWLAEHAAGFPGYTDPELMIPADHLKHRKAGLMKAHRAEIIEIHRGFYKSLEHVAIFGDDETYQEIRAQFADHAFTYRSVLGLSEEDVCDLLFELDKKQEGIAPKPDAEFSLN